MKISDELATLRSGFPACAAVVFADLSTGMVLASDTVERTTQEKLDELCVEARDCLLGCGGKTTDVDGADMLPNPPDIAWIADEDGIRCFFLAPPPAAEALCIVMTKCCALENVTQRAREFLARVAGEN